MSSLSHPPTVTQYTSTHTDIGHPDRTATHTHTRRQFFDCFLLQLCSSSVRLLAVGYMHASYTDAFVQHRIVSSGSGITLLVRWTQRTNERRWYQFVYTNLIGSVDSVDSVVDTTMLRERTPCIQVFVSFASAADSNFVVQRHCLATHIERDWDGKRQFIAERSPGTLFMSSIWSETISKPRSIIIHPDVGEGKWWWAFVGFISPAILLASTARTDSADINIQWMLMITCNLIIIIS